MSAPRDWRAMTHEELYAAVQSGPGAGASMAAEAMWRRLAEIVDGAERRMHAAVGRSADGWQGEGGDAARSGLHTLNTWALDAANDARITLSAVLDQGVSAGRLRSMMPAPRTEEVTAAQAQSVQYPGDANAEWAVVDARQRALAADEDARRKMEQYHWLSTENRSSIDFWTTPPTVTVEAASTSPAGGGGAQFGGGVAAARAGGPEGPGFTGGPPVPEPVPAGLPRGPDGAGGAGASGAGGLGPSGTPAGSGSPGAGSSGLGAGSAGAGSAGTGSAGAGSTGPGSTGPWAVGAGSAGSPGSAGPGSAGAGSPGAASTGSGPLGRPAGGPGPGFGRPTGGAPVTGVPGRPGGPSAGRDALPPGTGGRGPRTPPGPGATPGPATGWTRSGAGGPGFRAVVPGSPPVTNPSPTWRDLVNTQRGPNGGPVGGLGDPAAGSRVGAGGPGTAGPRPEPRPGFPGPGEAGRTGGGSAGSHGMYPPMGAAGQQGEGRRRPSYLVDDSGAFEVDVPCTDPVIGGTDPDPRPARD